MTKLAFHRPARLLVPELPNETATLPTPPEEPKENPTNGAWTLLMPLLNSVGMAAYMVTFGRPALIIIDAGQPGTSPAVVHRHHPAPSLRAAPSRRRLPAHPARLRRGAPRHVHPDGRPDGPAQRVRLGVHAGRRTLHRTDGPRRPAADGSIICGTGTGCCAQGGRGGDPTEVERGTLRNPGSRMTREREGSRRWSCAVSTIRPGNRTVTRSAICRSTARSCGKTIRHGLPGRQQRG